MGRQQRLKKQRHQQRLKKEHHHSRQAQLDLIAIKRNPKYECLVRLPTNREREEYGVNEPFLIQLFPTLQGIRKAILTDGESDIDGQIYDQAGMTALLEQGNQYIGMLEYEGIYS